MPRKDQQPDPIRPSNNRAALERVDKAVRLEKIKQKILERREQERIKKLKKTWKSKYDTWILATNRTEEVAQKISDDSKQTCTLLDVTKRRSYLRSMKQKKFTLNV